MRPNWVKFGTDVCSDLGKCHNQESGKKLRSKKFWNINENPSIIGFVWGEQKRYPDPLLSPFLGSKKHCLNGCYVISSSWVV